MKTNYSLIKIIIGILLLLFVIENSFAQSTNNISGILTASVSCNYVPIGGETLILADATGNPVSGITPVVTCSNGLFAFDYAELSTLNLGMIVQVIMQNGTEIENSVPIPLQAWFTGSPVHLFLSEITITVSQVNPSCFNSNNGAISISVTGGIAPYTYLWSNGATSAGITNLATGIYAVTVTDAKGCTTAEQIELSGNSIRIVYTLETCIGSCDGTAKVTMLEGTAPFTYSWSNGQTAQVAENLCEGTYTVTVTDAIGCVNIKNVTINTSFPVIGTQPPSYNITGNETWEGQIYYLQQNLNIAQGAKLTVSNCNIFVGAGKRITVNNGASLIIDNSVFDGYNYTNGSCLRSWAGIYVLGNAIYAHPMSPDISAPNHGFLRIRNNSKLFYSNGYYINNGIIWLHETSEIHNTIKGSSVYIDFNNNSPNRSKIEYCKFINKFFGYGAGMSISLSRVRDININHVEFNKVSSIGYSYGINTSNYGNVNINNCTFTNQSGAIYINRNSVIENNQFQNCNIAININNSSANITIKNNQFIVPAISGYNSYGIMAYASSNYTIRDNNFESSGSSSNPLYASYAIISDGTNYTGTIFYNTLKGTDIGVQTQGNNSGLNVRCNTFAAGSPHSTAGWVSLKNSYNGIGSLMPQGSNLCNSIGGDKYAAGNEWKEACNGTGEMDIKVDVSNPVMFWYFAHNIDMEGFLKTKPLCSTPIWESNIQSCVTNKTSSSCNNINPDYSGGGTAKSINSSDTTEILSLISQYKSERNSKQTLLDNGDKQIFIDNIHSNLAPGLIKNDLIAVSPYLSDRIIFAAINEKPTPFPSGILKEIIIANSPVTQQIKDALNLRNPALPKGIMNEINNAQTGISLRATVESRISWLTGQIAYLESSLVNLYIELGDSTTAINFMQQSTNPEVQKQLAWLFINMGNTTDARTALQAVLQYSDTQSLEENQNYCTIQNLIFDLADAGLDIFDITSAQEQTIRDVAASNTSAAYLAKQILFILYQEEFEFPIEKIPPSSLRLISDLKKNDVEKTYARIYPNPNNGTMQLIYSLEGNNDGILVIYNLTGEEIIRLNLHHKGIIDIPEFSYAQGIYFYKVITGNDVIASDKLIIIR